MTNFAMTKIKSKFPILVTKTIYMSLAQSHLIWGSNITGATTLSNLNKLEAIQN